MIVVYDGYGYWLEFFLGVSVGCFGYLWGGFGGRLSWGVVYCGEYCFGFGCYGFGVGGDWCGYFVYVFV